MQTHTINKQIVELEVDNRENGWELEQIVTSLLSNALADELEKVMDEVCRPDEYLILDKIELELGELRYVGFEQEFKSRFLKFFKDKVQDTYVLKGQLSPESKKDVVVIQNTDYIKRVFIYFLENGVLPWWCSKMSIRELEKSIRELKDEIKTKDLVERIRLKENTTERLFTQFSNEFIMEFIAGFNSVYVKELNEIIATLSDIVSELLSPLITSDQVKRFLLVYLINESEYTGRQKYLKQTTNKLFEQISRFLSIPVSEVVCSFHLLIISKYFDTSLPVLIQEMLISLKSYYYDPEIMFKSSFLKSNIYLFVDNILKQNKTVNLVEIKITTLKNLDRYIHAENIRRIFKYIEKMFQPDNKKALLTVNEEFIDELIHEAIDKIKLSIKKDQIHINDILQEYKKLIIEVKKYLPDKKEYEKTIEKIESILLAYLTEYGVEISQLVNLKSTITNAPEELFMIIKKELDTTKRNINAAKEESSLSGAEKEMKFEKDLLESRISDKTIMDKLLKEDEVMPKANTEEYYINNAGLVILSPFIKMLFEKLGYIDEKEDLSEQKAERGVYLLQSLVEENYLVEEPQLLLNKILCGVDINYPVQKNIELTDIEKNETLAVIEAAIKHWSKIGNTSVEGFRESFLRREGKLTNNDDSWTLIVERKGFDILLESIPWTFSLVNYPWMQKYIRVEW